jgi:chemotaxis regulatin CheY-phosphate phosphatase CheZ
MEKKMKHSENLVQLFDRLNELKYLFHYGQKIIPIIQSLIDFMKDTVPMLENINTSISDSASKIPKAQNQIHDVTSATEMATIEIMDIVDIISSDITKIEELINILIKKEERRKELFGRLKGILNDNRQGLELLEELDKESSSAESLSQILSLVQKTKSDAYNITVALQVQDITTQQLAAVNHLITSVQLRLSNLVHEIDENDVEVKDKPEIIIPDEETFNAEAKYDKDSSRQQLADQLLNKTSQDEIDKLFS